MERRRLRFAPPARRHRGRDRGDQGSARAPAHATISAAGCAMSDPVRGPAPMRIDAQAFADAVMAALPSDLFAVTPILRHVAALACFRAAERLSVLPPKIPEHVAAAVAEAFRNASLVSHIPEIRAGVSFLSAATGADAVRAAGGRVWPVFFERGAV